MPAQPLTPPAPAKPTSMRMPGPQTTPGGFAVSGRRAPQSKDTPRFTLSPRVILFLSLLVIVPTVIFIFKMGPVRAGQQWREAEPNVEADITDVINRYLEKAEIDSGGTLEKARDVPQLKNLVLDVPVMMWRFPKKMDFQGRSTEGRFYGTYYTQDRRVTARVEIHGDTHHITATTLNGKVTFEK
jgi:hypothetical protein